MIKKIFISLLLLCSAFLLIGAEGFIQNEKNKKFHFYYICFSDISSKATVISALQDSLANLSDDKDDFLLFISNGKNSSFYNSLSSTKEIISELNSINPYAPNIKSDFNKILEYLNNSDILFTTTSTDPLKLLFSCTSFNYYIDERFLDECKTFLIHRFIQVNEFNHLSDKNKIVFAILIERNSHKRLPVIKSDFKIHFYSIN